jgi:hypothetical protein
VKDAQDGFLRRNPRAGSAAVGMTVPGAGFEPALRRPHTPEAAAAPFLRRQRLPFRHPGIGGALLSAAEPPACPGAAHQSAIGDRSAQRPGPAEHRAWATRGRFKQRAFMCARQPAVLLWALHLVILQVVPATSTAPVRPRRQATSAQAPGVRAPRGPTHPRHASQKPAGPRARSSSVGLKPWAEEPARASRNDPRPQPRTPPPGGHLTPSRHAPPEHLSCEHPGCHSADGSAVTHCGG